MQRKINEFKKYHPIVIFAYFLVVITSSMFIMHPLAQMISIICAFMYSSYLRGKKAVIFNLMFLFPLILTTAVLNPAFNHKGVSIITYLPSGNPLTMESILYGISAGCMLATVICWFSCCNEIMTSDVLMYLFGKITPALSLVFSMTLRFVPRFKDQLKVIVNAQKNIGNDIKHGNIIKRAKTGIKILSILITWSLENAIETSDSMKSRGFGVGKRSAFSIYKFDRRDTLAIIYLLVLSTYMLVAIFSGELNFNYFPSIKYSPINSYNISVFIAYFLICVMPLIIEFWEVKKWEQ